MSVRDLADYMAASEMAKRTIVRNAKYQPIARVIQHDEARSTISKFIQDKNKDAEWLNGEAERLRHRLADSSFDRDLLDHNADYIQRFCEVWPLMESLSGTPSAPGIVSPIIFDGLRITIDLHVGLQRVTKQNKAKVGGIMLRYGKGETLPALVGEWQSAFLFGYLRDTSDPHSMTPEMRMCLTLDVNAGKWHPAPGNSISKFNNMKAACATIAERWDNVSPPSNAVL